MEELKPASQLNTSYPSVILTAVERALAKAWAPLSALDLERTTSALGALDPASRRPWLHARPGANHPAVIQHLVRQSYEKRIANPAEALRLAHAAVDVAEAIDLGEHGAALLTDLRAQAWANLANSHRLLEDHRGAEVAFARAVALGKAGSGDPLLEAETARQRGELRRDQARLADALRLQRRAVRLFESVRETHRAGKTRLNQAITHFQAGQVDKALDVLAVAGKQLEAGREPEIGFALLHNQLFFLEASGDDMLTLLLSKRTQELYRVMSPLVQYRALWLRGRVLLRLGAPAGAYGFLDACRRGFLAHNLRYDAALCGFDTALALVRQHKFFEANRMVSDMAEVFRAQEIPHQAARALEALASTGIACKLTLHAVEALARELEPVRKPGFRPGAGP